MKRVMTGKTRRKAKRAGWRAAFKSATVIVVFLGLLSGVEFAAAAVGIGDSPAVFAASAAFVSGIVAQRYVMG